VLNLSSLCLLAASAAFSALVTDMLSGGQPTT